MLNLHYQIRKDKITYDAKKTNNIQNSLYQRKTMLKRFVYVKKTS